MCSEIGGIHSTTCDRGMCSEIGGIHSVGVCSEIGGIHFITCVPAKGRAPMGAWQLSYFLWSGFLLQLMSLQFPRLACGGSHVQTPVSDW